MSGVPYTFGNATTTIALSNLDTNFATPATLGNTTVGLGNTVTSVGNLTLVNATISSLASQLPASAMPTGSVIQVVSATTTSSVSTTSASFVTTGLSASITPQFSTSKILVLMQSVIDSGVALTQVVLTLYRNSTNLSANGLTNAYGATARLLVPASLVYLDSPSTTSSTTYTVYFCNGTSTGNSVTFNEASGLGSETASLVLMEIR